MTDTPQETHVAPGHSPRRFSLLLVCTGNICRSPVAERLFSSTLGSEVQPSSAGTHALVGSPIAAPMRSLLEDAGARPDGFAATQLQEQHIQAADLVLALTREHRSAVVEMWPGAVRRAFTLREFVRLLRLVDRDKLAHGDVAARLSAAIPLAAAERRQVVHPATADDVQDPYGRSEENYEAAFRVIQDAVVGISQAIGAEGLSSPFFSRAAASS